jgi:hypothetical protein
MSCPVRSTLLVGFLALTGALPTSPARVEPTASATFHVSGRGKDSWSGTLPAPNASMDPDSDDFRLRPDSPALKLGFLSPKLPTVGLRDPAARHAE